MTSFAALGFRRAERVAAWSAQLPLVAPGGRIPAVVHQTYAGSGLPEVVADQVVAFRRVNPDWQLALYDDAAIERFIAEHYDPAVLATYRRIAPEYGAARADLFRYLVVYALGGVYLDIKSRFRGPLSGVLTGSEGFVLAQWRNGPGQTHAGSGLHPDLADVPGGEFQQWHVIAAPGHPFLRAVLAAVLANVETYSPWRSNVGRIGVLRMTGPIAYTRAIAPLLGGASHHTRIADETVIGLEYAYFNPSHAFGRPHYSELTSPLVKRGWTGRASGAAFQLALAARQRLR